MHTFPKEAIEEQRPLLWKSLWKHVLTPDDKEVDNNPRARSAKLRVGIKNMNLEPNSFHL